MQEFPIVHFWGIWDGFQFGQQAFAVLLDYRRSYSPTSNVVFQKSMNLGIRIGIDKIHNLDKLPNTWLNIAPWDDIHSKENLVKKLPLHLHIVQKITDYLLLYIHHFFSPMQEHSLPVFLMIASNSSPERDDLTNTFCASMSNSIFFTAREMANEVIEKESGKYQRVLFWDGHDIINSDVPVYHH